jgi:HNH endonuclease
MLTAKYLRTILRYNKRTGLFTWRINKGPTARKNGIAGSYNGQGYRDIMIDGTTYRASRLAFLYVNGRWPKNDVDHIDANRTNDAWKNLRPATRGQNCWNRKLSTANTTGAKGVDRVKYGLYRAKIQHKGKVIYLGRFQTLNEAALTYATAAKRLRGEFARV